MFTRHRTKALFLKKTNQGETNQVFTVYTKDFGKLKVTAKAIRKIKSKLKSGAEIFYYSEIEFIQGKTHKILTDADLIRKFRKSLPQMQIAYKITRALDDLVKGEEEDKKIWNLAIETFERLEHNREIVYYYFFWNLLTILGYQPEVWHCVSCQKKLIPLNLYFDSGRGGVICKDCFTMQKAGKEISPETIKILRIFFKKRCTILSKLKINNQYKKSLAIISEDYFAHILKANTI